MSLSGGFSKSSLLLSQDWNTSARTGVQPLLLHAATTY